MVEARQRFRLVTLSEADQTALRRLLQAPGRAGGAWIGDEWGCDPATILGPAAGLPCREATAALIKAKLVEKGAT